MIFQHHRFQIWNLSQHPYKHPVSEFSYLHDALPGVTNVESALNYILAVLYPQTKESVADVASLPSVGNTINDFRVVTDDGDGKAAAYRWEQREGDAAAKWYKIYDMDWGSDSILEGFLTKTQDLYVFRGGYDDLDYTGAAVTGTYAGQRIFGGKSASTNLTLSANSGDGVGSNTGYVQFTDNLRPVSSNTYDFGNTTEKWKKIWTYAANIDTLTITTGSIVDSTGAISFDNENLSTTGSITGGQVNADNLRLDGSTFSSTNTDGDINIYPNGVGKAYLGTQVQASSTVFTAHSHKTYFHVDSNFGNLSSANPYAATVLRTYANPTTGSQTGDLDGVMVFAEVAGNQSVTSIHGIHAEAIYSGSSTVTDVNGGRFELSNTSTGTITNAYTVYIEAPTNTGGGTLTNSYSLYAESTARIGNLTFNANTLASVNTNGDIIIDPNGTGIIQVQANLKMYGSTTIQHDGEASYLRLATGVLYLEDTAPTITLIDSDTSDGFALKPLSFEAVGTTMSWYCDTFIMGDTAQSAAMAAIRPFATGGSLGASGYGWSNLYLDTAILNTAGTTLIGTTALGTLRYVNYRDTGTTPAQSGDALFFNGTYWLASAPDSEIDHGSLTGIGDDDHTQYTLLAGRSGGQTLTGGTAASNSLTLESTSHGTKGSILFSSNAKPTTDAAYSGGWNGTDLGGSSNFFRHVYTKGEHFNFRLENVTAVPSASANNIGRLVYDTVLKSIFIDEGGTWTRIESNRYIEDTSWNGSDTTKTVTVSSGVTDARNCIWALHDNTNDYERIYCSIKAISATQITITLGVPLASGSYRLIGLE